MDGSKLDRSNIWKVNAIKKEIPIVDSTDKYIHWIIYKFTLIAKRVILTTKRLAKMIILDVMTSQEID